MRRVATAAIALGTVALIGPVVVRWQPPAQCLQTHASDDALASYFGVDGLDNALCIIGHFFQQSQALPSEPVADIVSALLVNCVAAMVLFMGFESTRHGARGPVAWPAFIGTAYQWGGIFFAASVLWLPSFFASYPEPLATTRALPLGDTTLASRALLWFIGLGTCAFAVVFHGMHFAHGPLFAHAFIVFQFWPSLFPLLYPAVRWWSPHPTSVAEAAAASSTASFLYRAFAAALTLQHWGTLAIVLAHADAMDLVDGFASLVRTSPPDASLIPSWFLVVDGVSVFASMTLLVVAEARNGARTFAHLVLASFLLGPGAAFSLLCATREDAIRSTHFSKTKRP
ncbi:hypothetical protein SPRG_03406 [Saprolegnia parasitica CBS 223.65]|uniref:Uncharacterized protein n=1 Tax=Saprolegnia parasitica (strain CBS 223.65) TaxID=695850 RepID=A0A067CNE6_SAPPC|nr:hypothetical protein SPRG_03406 [Saprolegnia parasitica CBS 223.65]KDO32189.1 hypothetical protein SPRG_03406 [Saprolegnia parasitica CBS 223.65]|eukprot:XP_012197370.1 hypothetical protein SPRG_03406 [Saprolegnia parasitica CBS 223.65]